MRDIVRYIKEYKEERFEIYQSEYRKKFILQIIDKYKPKDLLEIGCGTDPIFAHIPYMHNMTIVEPGQEFYEAALKLSRSTGLNVRCICGFMEQVDLSGNNFDFILCSSLLHEVEKPEVLLKKIYDVSDSNTVIHFNVPNANSLHRLIAVGGGLIERQDCLSKRNIELQQNNVFNLDTLSEMVRAAGFDIIEKGSYFIKPFTHKQMHEMMNSNIIGKEVLDGLFDLSKYLPQFGSEIYVNVRKVL